jgi:hypothetical protein
MKTFLAVAVALILCVAVCDTAADVSGPNRAVCQVARSNRPVVYLPTPLRSPNWTDRSGEGSCGYASVIYSLRAQIEDQKAEFIHRHYAGGAKFSYTLETRQLLPQSQFLQDLDRAGVRYAATVQRADFAFLERAIAGRRGVAISWSIDSPCDHMVTLVDINRRTVTIWDSNHPGVFKTMPRATFNILWVQANSFALVPVHDPAPPTP